MVIEPTTPIEQEKGGNENGEGKIYLEEGSRF